MSIPVDCGGCAPPVYLDADESVVASPAGPLNGVRMSDGWTSIDTAPLDGRTVYVKRVYQGRIVSEGEAVFGLAHENAPMRYSMGLDPLGRMSAADYRREAQERAEFVAEKKWLTPDRMYCFPTPTHWRPGKTKPLPSPYYCDHCQDRGSVLQAIIEPPMSFEMSDEIVFQPVFPTRQTVCPGCLGAPESLRNI